MQDHGRALRHGLLRKHAAAVGELELVLLLALGGRDEDDLALRDGGLFAGLAGAAGALSGARVVRRHKTNGVGRRGVERSAFCDP